MLDRRAFALLGSMISAAYGCIPDLGLPGATSDNGAVTPAPDDGDAQDDVAEAAENPYWCCDPDQPRCVCQGPWRCTEGVGGKVCRQANPELPDDGGDTSWSCVYVERNIVCTGPSADHPDAGSNEGWTCVQDGGNVVCTLEGTDEDFPEDDGETSWDCSYSSRAEVRACQEAQEEEEAPEAGEADEWNCTVGGDGRTVCTNASPDQPDEGFWACERVDGVDICDGDHFPDGGESNGWTCEQIAEVVRCRDDSPQLPDQGDDVGWDCSWERSSLSCIDLPDDGGGEVTPPEENPDGGEEAVCGCRVGAQRTCDEPEYCLFGTQTCEDSGGARRWGTCAESAILIGCEPGGDLADDYLWTYRGGYWDRDDQREQDEDGDGRILIAPDWWYNAAGQDCAMRMGRCVQDMWDLDQDGDNQESMGDCEDALECV